MCGCADEVCLLRIKDALMLLVDVLMKIKR
jgi:hypothetical protein